MFIYININDDNCLGSNKQVTEIENRELSFIWKDREAFQKREYLSCGMKDEIFSEMDWENRQREKGGFEGGKGLASRKKIMTAVVFIDAFLHSNTIPKLALYYIFTFWKPHQYLTTLKLREESQREKWFTLSHSMPSDKQVR